jgi:uncharacterized membrane protein
MMNGVDEVRAAIQRVLDAADDGWQLGASFVIIMGIERVTDQGIEATSWYLHPPEQPNWATDGLLNAAIQAREFADED